MDPDNWNGDNPQVSSAALPVALRVALQDAGVIPAQLARAVGVSRGTVSRWLSGRIRPSRKMARKVADFLQIPPQSIREDFAEAARAENEESSAELTAAHHLRHTSLLLQRLTVFELQELVIWLCSSKEALNFLSLQVHRRAVEKATAD